MLIVMVAMGCRDSKDDTAEEVLSEARDDGTALSGAEMSDTDALRDLNSDAREAF